MLQWRSWKDACRAEWGPGSFNPTGIEIHGVVQGVQTMQIVDFLHSDRGSIVVSAIMGFGLATLFRQTCKRDCIVVKAPDLEQLRRHAYEIDGACYRYTPRSVPCGPPTSS